MTFFELGQRKSLSPDWFSSTVLSQPPHPPSPPTACCLFFFYTRDTSAKTNGNSRPSFRGLFLLPSPPNFAADLFPPPPLPSPLPLSKIENRRGDRFGPCANAPRAHLKEKKPQFSSRMIIAGAYRPTDFALA